MVFLARLVFVSVLIVGLSGFSWIDRAFAPRADLWPFWDHADNDNTATINHAAWSKFLKSYLREGGDGSISVAYAEVSPEDLQGLKQYVAGLAGLVIRDFARNEQFSYWINLYNARTVLLILDNYPVDSINDINLGSGFFSKGPWSADLLRIEGQDVSLNDIEHRILRPGWKEARVHYALNCASRGCPDLLPEAFTAANAESLLEQGARRYINHPRGVSVSGDGLVLSKIYSWFGTDFGEYEEDLRDHLIRYAQPELRKALETKPAIRDYQYDWSLNDAKP